MDSIHAGSRPGLHNGQRVGKLNFHNGIEEEQCFPVAGKPMVDTTIDMTESMPVASRGQGGRSRRPASFRLSGWTKGDAGKNSHNGNEEEGKNFLTVVEKRGLRLSGAVMVQ